MESRFLPLMVLYQSSRFAVADRHRHPPRTMPWYGLYQKLAREGFTVIRIIGLESWASSSVAISTHGPSASPGCSTAGLR